MRGKVIVIVLLSVLLCGALPAAQVVPRTATQSFITADEPDFPSVSGLANVTYLEGETGVWITWIASDTTPASYYIELDGVIVSYRPWDGSNITHLVDGLMDGVHTYTCVAIDAFNRSGADDLFVTVIDGTSPVVSHPEDLYTALGSDVVVEWQIYDRNPGNYSLFVDDALQTTMSWSADNETIRYSSGTLVASHKYTLRAVDKLGHITEDHVFVFVDAQAPVIASPPDIEYLEGMDDVSIRWAVQEMFPYEYGVTRNGSTIFRGPWDGSDIVVDVSDLPQGVYFYELNVTDESGLFDTDTVKVKVLDGAAPVIVPADDVVLRETGQVQMLTVLWDVYDASPYWYTITFDYYGSGHVMESLPWDGTDVLLSCWDNFVSGEYTVTLTLLDEQGNSAEDWVLLVVTLDTQSPVITDTSNIEYVEGADDVSIRWAVQEIFPYEYEVTRNGSTILRGPWDGSDIVVDVSGLPQGVYFYELNVTDESGLFDTSIVKVTVWDGTPPTVSSPDDITAKDTGYMQSVLLAWHASDQNPYWYSVWFGRGLPDVIIDEGPWDGSDIHVQHDSYYMVGEYVFRLTLVDERGNSATDEVYLSVVAGWPLISSPFDIQYTQGEVPLPISWTISDSSPVRYTVSRNDTVVARGSWTGDAVVIDISGLPHGTHVFEIEAWNTDGSYASDSVTVMVDRDVLPPVVNSPPDAVFVFGSVGMSIKWICSDLNPYSYQVSRNGTLLLQTSWTGQEVVVALEGLEVGGYEYELTLTDINGNVVTDSVQVTVLASGSLPTVNTDLSPAITVPALLIAGAACGALAVIMLYRRKD